MLRSLLLVALALAGIAHADEAPPPPKSPLRVLMLFPGDLLMTWAQDQAENTSHAIAAAVPGRVEFFAEGLDGLRLPGTADENEFVALLLKRYAEIPPDLIVVHGPMEDFVARQRATLWPGTPLMVASQFAGPLSKAGYPEGIPGTSVSFDAARTLDIALRLQPDAKRVVVVGGSSEYSLGEVQRTVAALEPYRGRLDIESLVDLPMEEMKRRLAALPRDSIVFQLPIFRDAAGAIREPHEIAGALAEAANAPSYAYYNTAVGPGLLGGAMANWEGQRDMIGRIARELLLGEPRRESLLMHPPVSSVCLVDWRQMKRWDLDFERLPEGCEVRFREATLWEQFHREVLVAIAVLLIQMALIIALVLQRQRRHRAELELLEQRSQLAHATRLATVGELSASIAHEINQPLAAILSNAEAGEFLISSGAGADKLVDLKEILTAIRQDDLRASDVIERMRRLLHNEPVEMRPLQVNDAVESIVRLTRGLALRNGVSVYTALAPTLPSIKGDYVQMQQVLLNLVMNAVEAVSAGPVERRRVTITTVERPAGSVEVEVKDGGPGIAKDKLARIFEPFFTTKPSGMGLGLSITRSILNAHRGSIRAESDESGATFRFTLPT
jgi:signal transduction histidine kinase